MYTLHTYFILWLNFIHGSHHYYQEFTRVSNTCYNVSNNIIHTQCEFKLVHKITIVPTTYSDGATQQMGRSERYCLIVM